MNSSLATGIEINPSFAQANGISHIELPAHAVVLGSSADGVQTGRRDLKDRIKQFRRRP